MYYLDIASRGRQVIVWPQFALQFSRIDCTSMLP